MAAKQYKGTTIDIDSGYTVSKTNPIFISMPEELRRLEELRRMVEEAQAIINKYKIEI